MHPFNIIYYRDGQGPKLCTSLEDSIAHILAEDTQFLEDLQGKMSFKVLVYVSRCRSWVGQVYICDTQMRDTASSFMIACPWKAIHPALNFCMRYR